MIFIDPLFFEFEPVKIANIFDNGDVKADVARFIGIYEKQCLKDVLGECLYKEVQDSYTFDADEKKFVIKPDATQAIINLVNGFSYDAPDRTDMVVDYYLTYNGCGCGCGNSNCNKREWKGFVQEDEFLIGDALSSIKKSFIADYVYYFYLLENRSITAGTGQQVLAGENSNTVSNFSKRIDRWNEFIMSVIGGRKGETSLYQFLRDNKSDYPAWTRSCNLQFKTKW